MSQREELDNAFASSEIHRPTKNVKSSQIENLSFNRRVWTLAILVHRSAQVANLPNWVLHSRNHKSRWAAVALVRRVDFFPHLLPLRYITPQNARPGYWILEFRWKGDACITTRLAVSVLSATPLLHQALVGSPIPGRTLNSFTLKSLHSLSIYHV